MKKKEKEVYILSGQKRRTPVSSSTSRTTPENSSSDCKKCLDFQNQYETKIGSLGRPCTILQFLSDRIKKT